MKKAGRATLSDARPLTQGEPRRHTTCQHLGMRRFWSRILSIITSTTTSTTIITTTTTNLLLTTLNYY